MLSTFVFFDDPDIDTTEHVEDQSIDTIDHEDDLATDATKHDGEQAIDTIIHVDDEIYFNRISKQHYRVIISLTGNKYS